MKKLILILAGLAFCVGAFAQSDVKGVRSGNRKFKSENYRAAEIDYRRALVEDSTSVAATYDLASALYRQQDYEGACKMLSKISDEALEGNADASKVHFNRGDAALQEKDYAKAVEEFKAALLQTPDDMDAKENYAFALEMLKNQQNQDQQNQDRQQNQNSDDNKDQQPQQDQQDQQDRQDQQQQPQPQEQKISPQQAQQVLKAIQAKEKETQDKVEKEKAEALKSKQKEKNW